MKNITILLYIFWVSLICCSAQTQKKIILPSEVADKIHVAGTPSLELDIRQAVTDGAGYLLQQANKQTYTGLFVPPNQSYKALDVKDIEIRYRWGVRKIPVYEYKKIKTMGRDRYGNLIEVMRQYPVKEIGTRDDKYLIRDDNGDVVKIRHQAGGYDLKRPVGPAHYLAGKLGQNGMCLYALLVGGVPLDSEPIPLAVKTLQDHLDEYGLPDRTWDLAWLVAAFSNLPKGDEKLEHLKLMLVNKLLLGQIRAGRSKGLWGPVCVNPDIVAAMMTYEQKKYSKTLGKLKADLKANPEKRSIQRKLERLDEEQNIFSDQYKYYTQTWTARNPQAVFIELGDRENITHWIRVPGMINFIYGESIADLESTRLVLFALNEARCHGYLPSRTLMPKDDGNGRDLIPAYQLNIIIKNALRAVSQLVMRDGSWGEGNICGAVNAFDSFGFAGLPVNKSKLPKLKTESTALSTADGYAALQILSKFNGIKVARSQLGVGAALLGTRVPGIIEKQIKPGNRDKSREPYKLALSLAGIPNPTAAISSLLVNYLLTTRTETPDMCWGGGWVYMDGTTGFKAYTKETLVRVFDIWKVRNPAVYSKYTDDVKTIILRYQRGYYWRRMNDDVFRTASAMIYLAGIAKSSSAGIWPWSETMQKDVVVPRVLGQLQKSAGLTKPLTHILLKKDLSDLSMALPVVYLTGSGKFLPEKESLSRLTEYLAGDGLLVGLARSSAEGDLFLDGVENKVLKLLPGSELKQFTLSGGKLQAVIREDGMIAMVSFSVGTKAAAGQGTRPVLPGQLALRLMTEVFKARLGPERLSDKPMVDLTRLSELQQSAFDAPIEE